FNAPHTHSTTPPIDNCGNGDCSLASQGTIMSYCHTCPGGMTNIALDLHTRIINENILPYLNANQGCIPLAYDVAIQLQPSAGSAPQGSTIQISVGATGGPPLTYQWRKNQINLSNGTHFSGVRTPTLTITNLQFTDSGNYDCVVSGACSSVNTSATSLTVVVPAPVVTSQPAAQSVCDGNSAR